MSPDTDVCQLVKDTIARSATRQGSKPGQSQKLAAIRIVELPYKYFDGWDFTTPDPLPSTSQAPFNTYSTELALGELSCGTWDSGRSSISFFEIAIWDYPGINGGKVVYPPYRSNDPETFMLRSESIYDLRDPKWVNLPRGEWGIVVSPGR